MVYYSSLPGFVTAMTSTAHPKVVQKYNRSNHFATIWLDNCESPVVISFESYTAIQMVDESKPVGSVKTYWVLIEWPQMSRKRKRKKKNDMVWVWVHQILTLINWFLVSHPIISIMEHIFTSVMNFCYKSMWGMLIPLPWVLKAPRYPHLHPSFPYWGAKISDRLL